MHYHIMLTKKISDLKGQLHTQIQVMDFPINFTLDELERNDLPEELKEYKKGIIPDIEEGR